MRLQEFDHVFFPNLVYLVLLMRNLHFLLLFRSRLLRKVDKQILKHLFRRLIFLLLRNVMEHLREYHIDQGM